MTTELQFLKTLFLYLLILKSVEYFLFGATTHNFSIKIKGYAFLLLLELTQSLLVFGPLGTWQVAFEF